MNNLALLRLKTLLAESLRASGAEYERLMRALREKNPAVTDERIDETVRQWARTGIKAAHTHAEMGVFAGAYYRAARSAAEGCLRELTAGKPTAQSVIDAHVDDAALWRAVAMVAVALHGGPVAESYFEDTLEGRRQTDRKLQDIQAAYNDLLEQSAKDGSGERGRAPSQRAVAERSGYPRETVRARWAFLRKHEK
jgi:hypothetical protein